MSRSRLVDLMARGELAKAILTLSAITAFFTQSDPPKLRHVEEFILAVYLAAWVKAYEAAIATALKIFLDQGALPISNADTHELIDTIDGVMKDAWPKQINDDVEKAVLTAYVLAKKAVAKSTGQPIGNGDKKKVAGITVTWDKIIDDKAVAWLSQDTLYWIGTYYSREVAQKISEIVKQVMFENGMDRIEIAQALKESLGEHFEKSTVYWEGLAANIVTKTSVLGAIQAMVESKTQTYKFVAVIDDRTSEICQHMDGTIFKVDVAVGIRDRLLAANSPEEAKAVMSWPSGDRLQAALQTNDVEELDRLGVAIPPLHFHCRSQIVVQSL